VLERKKGKKLFVFFSIILNHLENPTQSKPPSPQHKPLRHKKLNNFHHYTINTEETLESFLLNITFQSVSINNQLTSDMKSAMKAKDSLKLSTIRALKSAIKNASIEKGDSLGELSDSEVTGIIRKQVKQRQDSFEQFTNAGRPELAEKEKLELKILQEYLPAPLTEAELQTAVTEAITETKATSRADMGKVIGFLQKSTEGRVDGKTLSQAVIKALS